MDAPPRPVEEVEQRIPNTQQVRLLRRRGRYPRAGQRGETKTTDGRVSDVNGRANDNGRRAQPTQRPADAALE